MTVMSTWLTIITPALIMTMLIVSIVISIPIVSTNAVAL